MNKLEASAIKLLVSNRRTRNGFTFTIPSPHQYRHQWLWDSCFHAIVLRHFDPDAAEKELLGLVASQKENGMIPHESKYSPLGFTLPFTSRITQPPFIARAALDVYQKSKNKDFLQQVFPSLERHHTWLKKNRTAEGALKYVDPSESGEDNSIPWDAELMLPWHRTYARMLPAYVPFFPQLAALRTVTGTSAYIDALASMGKISRIIGKHKLASLYHKKESAVAEAAFRLFRQDDGNFYNVTSHGKAITWKTHSLFSPLFAGIPTKSEAKRLVNNHLLNEEEFWTPFPIPTVAISEKKFSPKGYWRGPTWINMNWMIYRGLKRYKLKEADELLEKTAAAIKKSGFREYYNPLTGEGLGAKDFSWSTLIVDMMRGSHSKE